jgi:hypothetical protein
MAGVPLLLTNQLLPFESERVDMLMVFGLVLVCIFAIYCRYRINSVSKSFNYSLDPTDCDGRVQTSSTQSSQELLAKARHKRRRAKPRKQIRRRKPGRR